MRDCGGPVPSTWSLATAAMALSIEKIEKLTNPDTGLSCDFSVLVQCSANLDSAQGAAFGVPNPFLGLVGFALVVQYDQM